MASQHMAIGSFKDAQKVIEKYDSIIIFHHTRPDGDCLGSQFGLRQLIRDNYPNKKVYAIGDTGGSFSFLNFDFDNEPSDELLAKSLGIIVDANFKERIYLRQYLEQKSFCRNTKNWPSPKWWWFRTSALDGLNQIELLLAEMIAELAYQTGWKVSHTTAEYIFLGMITDSGRFQFSDTSARTHELVAFLYKTGFNADKVFTGLGSNRLARFKTN